MKERKTTNLHTAAEIALIKAVSVTPAVNGTKTDNQVSTDTEDVWNKAKTEIEKIKIETENKKARRAVVQNEIAEAHKKAAEKSLRDLTNLKIFIPLILQEANEKLCENTGVVSTWTDFHEIHQDYSGNYEDPTDYPTDGIRTDLKIPNLNGRVHVFLTYEKVLIGPASIFEGIESTNSSLNHFTLDSDLNSLNVYRKCIAKSVVKLHNKDLYP